MMKILNQIKAGARVAPAFSILLYYLSVALDIYTTYLASPDLRYEGNWFIRYFHLSWNQIIIIDSIIVLIVPLSLILALNYIYNYYRESIKNSHFFIVEIISKWKLLLSFILVCCFYTHLSYSAFLVINNYLHYVYLYKIKNLLTQISTFYITKVIMDHPHIFIWFSIFFAITAIIFTTCKVKNIRNKYRTIPV